VPALAGASYLCLLPIRVHNHMLEGAAIQRPKNAFLCGSYCGGSRPIVHERELTKCATVLILKHGGRLSLEGHVKLPTLYDIKEVAFVALGNIG
jgi:hypothetical protein